MQLKSKLNLSLRYHYVGDDARRAGSVRDKCTRLLKYWMVECVEEFSTEFQILVLGNVEEFAQG